MSAQLTGQFSQDGEKSHLSFRKDSRRKTGCLRVGKEDKKSAGEAALPPPPTGLGGRAGLSQFPLRNSGRPGASHPAGTSAARAPPGGAPSPARPPPGPTARPPAGSGSELPPPLQTHQRKNAALHLPSKTRASPGPSPRIPLRLRCPTSSSPNASWRPHKLQGGGRASDREMGQNRLAPALEPPARPRGRRSPEPVRTPEPRRYQHSTPLRPAAGPPRPLWTPGAAAPSRGGPGLAPAWRQGNGGGRFRSASSDISHNRVDAACRPRRPRRYSACSSWLQAAARTLPGPPRLYRVLGAGNPRKNGTLRGPWAANTELQTLT